jgi:hypothetical protein
MGMKEEKSTGGVAEIMQRGLPDYIARYGPLTEKQAKVAYHILSCRTPLMGGHCFTCDTCNHAVVTYNSCRDRHCPLCQGVARAHWVQKRMDEILPVGYFHVVFTLPHELNAITMRNKQRMYALLFAAASETMRELAADRRFLGAQIGCVAMLHTWGQAMHEHPHLHFIVPGGGIRSDGKKWVSFRDRYLFPVPVMRDLFRGKFLSCLQEEVRAGRIEFSGAVSHYADPQEFCSLLSDLYAKEWVVYVKEPFADAQCVVKYLGRYTHRIAISNQRIVSMDDRTVSFQWKDYADNNASKIMTLTLVEFIRRFFLHVLPDRFTRIRYYGFLSNGSKGKLLAKCFELLQKRFEKRQHPTHIAEILKKILGIDISRCTRCAAGHYVRTHSFFGRPSRYASA